MYQPSPNPDRLASILRHEGRPGPVPFIELFADEPIMEAVLGHPMVPAEAQGEEAHRARARSLIAFYRQLGYDYVPVQLVSGLQRATAVTEDTAALSRGTRHWDNSTTGRITTWAEFEAYPWPRPEHIDYTPAEVLLEELPDDMGAIALGAGGVLEWVMWLMGYENLALGLYERPDLVYAMFQRVTYTLLNTCHSLIDMDGFLAYFVGDDMGHVSGTFISPQMMRLFVFPCQQRLVELVHDHGLPFALHSCGNLSAIMDDLINTVQIDAKHSFEDKIEPVESIHARYGRRIALLGGVDMDLLARGSEAAVRARTRQLLDALGPSGTWALGTGNTVANYIPLPNYLAMLDEGRRWNQENYGE